jgi:beta-glucanase (GH16 family)
MKRIPMRSEIVTLRTSVIAALLSCSALIAACASGDEETADTASTEPSTSTTAAPLPTTTIAAPEPIPIVPPQGMELVWSDEFDGDAIDRSNWTYDLGGWGWGNGEAQHYTDRPDNSRTENGLLVIELRQERYEDSYYTSARLKSQGLREFQYGRIEARVKVPSGAGTWPAFWMLGSNFEQDAELEANRWPFVGEIDIMEYVGREPDLVLGTVHGPGYSGAGGLTRWNRQDYDIADDFHTFAIEWDVDGIRWFYDDEMYFDLGRERVGDREWVFDRPFFIILNLALGGTLGGNIALDLDFPVHYYVDYVRVYQPVAE